MVFYEKLREGAYLKLSFFLAFSIAMLLFKVHLCYATTIEVDFDVSVWSKGNYVDRSVVRDSSFSPFDTKIKIIFDDEVISATHYVNPSSTSVTESYDSRFGSPQIFSPLKNDFVNLPYLNSPSSSAYTKADTYDWNGLKSGLNFRDQYSGDLDTVKSWDYIFTLYKFGHPVDSLYQFDSSSLLNWLTDLKNTNTYLSLIEGSRVYLPNSNYNAIDGFQYLGRAYISEIKVNMNSATPVPEPSSIILLLFGIVSLTIRAAYQKIKMSNE